MRFAILLAVAATAYSDKLNKPLNLPTDAAAAGGAGAGLQAPLASQARAYQSPGQTYVPQSRAAQNYGPQSRNAQSSPAQTSLIQSNASLRSAARSYASRSSAARATILRYDNEVNENGYQYAVETSDGARVEQRGRVLPGPAPEQGSLQVTGSYSYTGDDGRTYTVTYTADEGGYRATGAHLPTPPPVPEEILRSLQLTVGTGANYDSKKSSYDADAGY